MFQKQSLKLIGFSTLIGFLLQGCIADKGGLSLTESVQCSMDTPCKQGKPKIIKVLLDCYQNENGADVNKIFNKNRKYGYVFNKYLVDKKFEDTNLTYTQVKEMCQTKYEAEKSRIESEKQAKADKLQKEREEDLKHNNLLAKKNGYKGFVQYNSIEGFIRDAEYGNININDYKGYVISNNEDGTYAYKFSQLVKDIEMYHPDYRYGLKLSVGIKRDKAQTNMPLEGQPLQSTGIISFIGVQTYKTVLGVNKQILMFDRAGKYRVAYATSILKALEKKLSEKK